MADFKKGQSDLLITTHDKLLRGGEAGKALMSSGDDGYPEWTLISEGGTSLGPIEDAIDQLEIDTAALLASIDALQIQLDANDDVDTNLSNTVNNVLVPSNVQFANILMGGTAGQFLTAVAGGADPIWTTMAAGPEGPQGPQGDTGPAGADGAVGATGPQGLQGQDGPVGPAGAQGIQGPSGPQGTPGEAGVDGRTVLNGVVPPVDGVDGVDGDFFLNTATSDLYGPKAGGVWPTPPVSLIGPQGVQGDAGATGATGADGADGADGTDGADGDPVTPISTETGLDVLILASHAQTMIERDNAAANTVTVQPEATEAIPVNSRIDIMQIGAGATTLVEGAGVTIHPQEGSTLELAGQWAACSIIKRGSDEWSTVGRFVQA